MSSTRHVEHGSARKDECFASDPALCRGLRAGDVVRRCEVLSSPAEIEMALFLQHISNLPGGLDKLAADLLSEFSDRIGTPVMRAIPTKRDGRYNAEEVRAVRDGARSLFVRDEFLTRGEWAFSLADLASQDENRESQRADEASRHPHSYSVSVFMDACRQHFLTSAPSLMRQFCLDPQFPLALVELESFHGLPDALLAYLDIWERKTLANLVITHLGAKVVEALEYTEEQRTLSLVEGFARTGKSFIAEAWANARPGRRRIVSLSEASSEKEFFREIAKALGAAAGYGFKANEIRERVNDILRAGHLTLVIDEAHWLWPSRNVREALPRRIEWVRCSLVNHRVPVAMISTHQFTRSQQVIEKNTHCSSEQLIGRIGFCARLPDHLERDDIASVVRFHLPEAEDRTVNYLINYVVGSKKYLAAIDHMVQAARHEAHKAGRNRVTHRDVILGFDNTVVPSDAQLAAMSAPCQQRLPLSRSRARGSRIYTSTDVSVTQPILPAPLSEREAAAALAVPQSDRRERSSLPSSSAS